MANTNVTIMWLVKVKLYGNNPSKLPNKINVNSVNIKGKNYSPFSQILSQIIFAINSKNNSEIDCNRVGINFLFLIEINNKNDTDMIVRIIKNDELVKDKFKSKNSIGTNSLISN